MNLPVGHQPSAPQSKWHWWITTAESLRIMYTLDIVINFCFLFFTIIIQSGSRCAVCLFSSSSTLSCITIKTIFRNVSLSHIVYMWGLSGMKHLYSFIYSLGETWAVGHISILILLFSLSIISLRCIRAPNILRDSRRCLIHVSARLITSM